MKVLFIANDSIHTYRWLEASLNEGLETVWIRTAPIQRTRYRLRKASDLTVYNFSSRIKPLGYARTLIEVGRIIRREAPSLIHAHYLSHNGLIANLRKGNTPLIVSVWGSDLESFMRVLGPLGLSHKVFSRFDLVTTCGEHFRDYLLRSGLVNEQNCVTLPFGVATEVFRPGSVPLNSREFDVISTRMHESIYRTDTLLHALNALGKKHHLKPRTLIVGEGSQTRYLKNLSREYGLANQVRFEGFVESSKMPALLSRARIYVSCSIKDGASVSLLEAMSCGLIPVATNLQANQVWIDGKSGALFPVNNPVSLANKLKGILTLGIEQIESMSKANRMIVLKRGSYSTTLGRIKEHYDLAIQLHNETL